MWVFCLIVSSRSQCYSPSFLLSYTFRWSFFLIYSVIIIYLSAVLTNYDNSNFLSYPFGSLFFYLFWFKVKCCMTNYDFYLFILTYLSEHLFSLFNLVVDGLSLSLTCIFFKPFGNPIDTFSFGFPYHPALFAFLSV